MIINFKTFENLNDITECWIIPCETLDEFAASLLKIGTTDKGIEYMINKYPFIGIKNYTTISIFKDTQTNKLSWSPSHQYNTNTIFKGDITLTEEDMDNWNIKKESFKYNI